MLLADILPQPSQQHGHVGERAVFMGLDAFHDVLTHIDLMDLMEFDDTEGYLNFDWAADNVGPLSSLALVENAECASDVDSQHDGQGEQDARNLSGVAIPSTTASPMRSRSPREVWFRNGR